MQTTEPGKRFADLDKRDPEILHNCVYKPYFGLCLHRRKLWKCKEKCHLCQELSHGKRPRWLNCAVHVTLKENHKTKNELTSPSCTATRILCDLVTCVLDLKTQGSSPEQICEEVVKSFSTLTVHSEILLNFASWRPRLLMSPTDPKYLTSQRSETIW